MPLSPLLMEGVWMTSSGQTLPFQQRPGEMNSSLESNKCHDKGTSAEGANGDRVAKWPFGGKKGAEKLKLEEVRI